MTFAQQLAVHQQGEYFLSEETVKGALWKQKVNHVEC